jgi:hypothetical protein
MSDKPEPTAEEKMANALPANAKYVAAHPNSRRGLLVKPHVRFRHIRPDKVGLRCRSHAGHGPSVDLARAVRHGAPEGTDC